MIARCRRGRRVRVSLRAVGLLFGVGVALAAGCSGSQAASDSMGDASGANEAGDSFGPGAGASGAGEATGLSRGGVPGTHRSGLSVDNPDVVKGMQVARGCVDVAALNPPDRHAYYESADDSNSMGSPVLARQQLRAGLVPDPGTIRTYEFLNYYHVGYAPPASAAQVVAVHAAAVRTGATIELQVGVRAFQAVGQRLPLALTFVLDNSGSMATEGLARERAMLRAVARKLVAGDVVSVLTWSLTESVLLRRHAVTGPDDPALTGLIEGLRASGGSDLHAALQTAYEVAREGFDPRSVNRVVLVSDGGANLGVTDGSVIGAEAGKADSAEVYLTGVGTGPAQGYSDRLMNQLTDAGRGAYVYLDSDEEADRMFGDRFDEVLSVAARSVQVAVEVPWYLSIAGFDGEGYSPNPEDIEPQHLAPGGEMVFRQELSSCDEAQVQGSDLISVTVSWESKATPTNREAVSVSLPISDLRPSGGRELAKGGAIVRYAKALQATSGAHDLLVALHAEIEGLLGRPDLAGDVELGEIDELVQKHPAYASSAGK